MVCVDQWSTRILRRSAGRIRFRTGRRTAALVVVDADAVDLVAGNLHVGSLPAGSLEADENGLIAVHGYDSSRFQ